jgi:translation initiation factor 1 (eIF-1/SUI1)
MDLFAQLQRTTTVTEVSSAPVAQVAQTESKIITVAIEKVKNRTITVIYDLDVGLDKSVKSPEELLSKLKKKICSSNGFLRKPEAEAAKKQKHKQKSSDDEDEEAEESSESEEEEDSSKPVTGGIQYVIQGNHSNAICRYIYALGVTNIIRTGTA